ncbi:phosphatidylinositol 3,4,5-trisphosphate-dependent Rac exchanger 1 protein isoform X2 [Entelurus aequoreus]|uniref:phosphatidylinositol 3,4,5-trisphosphate-dependent Rac exchanger 1 protein isoform X2 n=1 Tax=Entelurus aequoreus TaxID=161455 RepID=UPI002B1D595B|nr:phosphatidylinositol 3,4,5-trisphosphate-dependent Rac exchanger 1 protein isoform X2 [Entelurus aequoreus]
MSAVAGVRVRVSRVASHTQADLSTLAIRASRREASILSHQVDLFSPWVDYWRWTKGEPGADPRREKTTSPRSLWRGWGQTMEEQDAHLETAHAVKESDRQQRLRLCVLNEMLNTERDYVRTLLFLQSAFLQRIRQTADDKQCLSPEHVKMLFSNIEDILELHKELLSSVEAVLQPEPQPYHALGHVFLQFRESFSVYGEYCSNHEKALRLLMELNKIPHVRTFLLHCMLLGGKKSTDVPLEGYLLSPIQRICKYPLLLKELLKRTPKKHADYPAVEEALQTMKAVCSNINETKRQMEKLEALEQLQSHIEGWEGTNLTDICSELLLHGNLLKISAGNIQQRVFFLFDNLLVYCKRKSRVSGKKSTKRTKSINGPLYVFRGRINTEVMEVENVEDGTADYHSNNYTVTNGWKIHNTAKNKWFVCMTKAAEDKQKWLDAILREREQRESLKLGMERDAYVMIAEKGEKLYHMMMTRSRHLIKDRRRKLSIVPKCFMGNEFVSWLMESGEISRADEGVNLGQALLENGIIHHVSDKHQFKNEQVMYRFRYDDGTYKARSEMEDIMSKGVRLYCRLHSLHSPVIKDRDHHLKTFKSVVPACKLIDWLLSQGDCSTRDDAVTLGVGLCNNGFMHHVLEKSEFKDESQFFRFYADEETEGTSAKSKQLQRNDFKLIENILVKSLLIDPEEEDYGFDIEEKNKAIVVKSVTRGSHAEMAGLQAGRKIHTINEDLLFLRPFSEVEAMIHQAFCMRRSLRLLVATKAKEMVKVPDNPDELSFRLAGSAPPHVHAVRKGWEAAGAGLQPGQVILKVNCNNVNGGDHQDVLEHFSAQHTHLRHPQVCQWVYRTFEDVEELRHKQTTSEEEEDGFRKYDTDHEEENGTNGTDYRLRSLSLSDDTPLVNLTVDNVHLEHGVFYEYVSTAGIKSHVLEKMVEPKGCFGLAAKILEAFCSDDRLFVSNCSQLISQGHKVVTMPQYEFRHICDTKLDSIRRRISSYQQFSLELRNTAWPSFRQAGVPPHPLGCMDFVPTNCHVNLMQVSYPKSATSAGRTFSIRFGRKNSLFGLDPDQAQLNPMSHTQHCVTSMGAPSWNSTGLDGEDSEESPNGVEGPTEGGLSFLLKQEDTETQDAYLHLYSRLDVAVREMKQYVAQINVLLSSITEPTQPQVEGGAEPPVYEAGQPPSLGPCEDPCEQDKVEPGGIKRVCFKVNEEDQEDSGHDTMSYRDSYSECNSNRDSVLSYTSVRSNSSYLGSDEMGSGDELPCDMRIPSDKQDKLHGCLEHLFNQVDAINTLLKGSVMTKACEQTKHFHADHSQPEFGQMEDWTVGCRYIIHKNIQEDPWNLPSAIKTLVESLQTFVDDGKNQLLLALLKCTDTSLQLRRDVIFCQVATSAVCTLTEQLLAALRCRFNNAGEYQEDGKETSRKWLEQVSAIGVLMHFQSTLAPHVREERTMLEDTKACLWDLDKVSVFFRPLEDEYLLANSPVCYQVEGSRQALKVTLHLDSCLFSELPSRLQNGGSLKLHTVLFTRALERAEGVSQQDLAAMEELQQRTDAVSLEKVKAYYRKLRAFYLEKSNLPTDSNTTAMKIDQLLRPLNTLDDLCRLMQSYVNVRPGSQGHPSGVSVLCVSSELCNRLGACHLTMCATGLHRSTLSVTLEQAMILARNHGLMPRCIMQTMDIMRKQGARVELSARNLKVMDQMPPSAPRLFRLCLPPSDGEL